MQKNTKTINPTTKNKIAKLNIRNDDIWFEMISKTTQKRKNNCETKYKERTIFSNFST